MGVGATVGKMGVVLDVDLLATPQDVVSGGRDTGGNMWTNIDYTLNVDTEKLRNLAGRIFQGIRRHGTRNRFVSQAGAIVPVNTGQFDPGYDDRTTALMNATFMQFLVPNSACSPARSIRLI